MTVKAVPEGFSTITPYIIVKDASKYIEFLKEAFDAQTISLCHHPNGTVSHATLRIGDSMIMLSEHHEEGPWAKDWTASPVTFYLYVPDADALYERTLRAGAEPLLKMEDQLYGDRIGAVRDAWGNKWCISTHIEDVSDAEIEKRFAEARSTANKG